MSTFNSNETQRKLRKEVYISMTWSIY